MESNVAGHTADVEQPSVLWPTAPVNFWKVIVWDKGPGHHRPVHRHDRDWIGIIAAYVGASRSKRSRGFSCGDPAILMATCTAVAA